MNDLCGYRYDERAIEAFLGSSPMVCGDPAPPASGAGKDFFLFDIEKALTGSVRDPHFQSIGDCVAEGTTGAAEDLQFVQMVKQPGNGFVWLSCEVTYALARIQVGRGACGYQDGAVVSWAFAASQQYGLVARGVYGRYDLTKYRPDLARTWGTPGVGCPPELAAEAKKHVVLRCSLITGAQKYEQARDVIYNGGVVVTGSNQLFAGTRDAQGFCAPEGNGGHCTYYRGFTDSGSRPGIAYQQSWGKGIPSGGPQDVTLPSGRVVTLPSGCFFVDADEFDLMHSGPGSEVWALWSEAGWLAPDEQVPFVFS
jgi:hypothetical protein